MHMSMAFAGRMYSAAALFANNFDRFSWRRPRLQWYSLLRNAGPHDGGKFVYNAIILKTGATCADLVFAEDPVDCKTDSKIDEGADAVLTPKTVGQV